MLPWDNPLGDWYDKQLAPQGDAPYGSLTHASWLGKNVLSADVTALANKWNLQLVENHGFFIRKAKSHAKIFSREGPDRATWPQLVLQTSEGDITLNPVKDTHLMKSTYRCLGQKPLLDLNHNTLIQFELPKALGQINKATLILHALKPIRNRAQFDIYAVRIAKALASQSAIPKLPSPAYSQSFEHEDWAREWKVQSLRNARLVNRNDSVKFEPYQGKALQLTIPKGRNSGAAADLHLESLQGFSSKRPNQAFLRYRLRLSDNWQPIRSGKFPGLSGRYGSEPYRAGWGGRRTTGMNGWSARMLFSTPVAENNQFSHGTPVGSYLYHANMDKRYGDALNWNQCERLVLNKNQWYTIDQYVQMNNKRQNNGELRVWVDGQACYVRTDLKYSDHPEVGIESVWLNLYHGGKEPAAADYSIFIDELRVSIDSPYQH